MQQPFVYTLAPFHQAPLLQTSVKVSQAEPVEVIAKHVDAGIKRTQQGTHALCMELPHTMH